MLLVSYPIVGLATNGFFSGFVGTLGYWYSVPFVGLSGDYWPGNPGPCLLDAELVSSLEPLQVPEGMPLGPELADAPAF